MKKRTVNSVMCLLFVALSTQVVIGQIIEVDSIMTSSDFFKSGNFIILENNANPKDVPVVVEERSSKLTLQIGGVIKSRRGGLTFEIFDPNGKLQDVFGIANASGSVVESLVIVEDKDEFTSEEASPAKNIVDKGEDPSETEAQFLREFSNPIPGKWIIKVIPRKEGGKFKVNHIITMK